MAHVHPHDHPHPARRDASAQLARAFAWGVMLNAGFVAIEGAAGFLTGSLALLADAGHNLSDVLSLVLAWAATWLAERPPTVRHSYGWRKSTILAALLGSSLLLVALGAFAWEVVHRLLRPAPVSGWAMSVVAACGLVVNGATAWLFARHRHGDLNVRAAFLHMAADAAVSAGVVVGGILVLATGWAWIDPGIGLVMVIVILIGTLDLFRDSLGLAMDAVPKRIDSTAVADYLRALPDVAEVHDLHIWGMSTRETALTAHLVVRGDVAADGLLHHIAADLRERFGIVHSTVQIERDGMHACAVACGERG